MKKIQVLKHSSYHKLHWTPNESDMTAIGWSSKSRNANQKKAGRKSGSTVLLPKRERQNLGGVTACARVDYELWKTALTSVMKQYLGLVWEVSLVRVSWAYLGKKNKQTRWSNNTSPSSNIHYLVQCPFKTIQSSWRHCTGSWYIYTALDHDIYTLQIKIFN